jgi:outer membrane protein assembly factor BamD (BamD/ComL family)
MRKHRQRILNCATKNNFENKMRIFSLLIISLFILAACQSPKEKALNHIKSIEANDSVFSDALMQELKTAYTDFAKAYPDDEKTPEFLFKAAQRSIVLQQPNEAITLLNQLLKEYPKSAHVEDATFLLAYTYENNLNDLPNAKNLYEEFLKKYPKGELAQDAQFALDNLGKSPEEVLTEIEAQ